MHSVCCCSASFRLRRGLGLSSSAKLRPHHTDYSVDSALEASNQFHNHHYHHPKGAQL